jgi:Cu2+-containing amine oxidase
MLWSAVRLDTDNQTHRANRCSHYTRDEDQVNMPIEWLSFEIQPRSFNHRSPLE